MKARKIHYTNSAISIIFSIIGIGLFLIPYTNNYGDIISVFTIILPLISTLFLIIAIAFSVLSFMRPVKENIFTKYLSVTIILLWTIAAVYLLTVNIN